MFRRLSRMVNGEEEKEKQKKKKEKEDRTHASPKEWLWWVVCPT